MSEDATITGSAISQCNGTAFPVEVSIRNSSTTGLRVTARGFSLSCLPQFLNIPFLIIDQNQVNLPTSDATTFFSSVYGELELRYVSDFQGIDWPSRLMEGFAAVGIVIRMTSGEKIDLGIVEVDAICDTSCISKCMAMSD